MTRKEKGSVPVTLLFIRLFLRRLSGCTYPISTDSMAGLVNSTMSPPLRPERAVRLTGLIRIAARSLGILSERSDSEGKILLFGPNIHVLPPDIGEGSIIEIAQKVLDAINRYQLPKPARRKKCVQDYVCRRDGDSVSVKVEDTIVTLTRAGELFITGKNEHRIGLIIDFSDKKGKEEQKPMRY